MRRLEDWEPRLGRFAAHMHRAPFGFGRVDCALFAAGGVEAVTGEDLARPHRGRYATPEEAAAYLEAQGWGDVWAMADAHLPRQTPQEARRGDLVGFRGEAGPTLGICIGEHAIVLSDDGARPIPMAGAEVSWRVG